MGIARRTAKKIKKRAYSLFSFLLYSTKKHVLWLLDHVLVKRDDIWVFPVYFFHESFSDNIRAVYEEVKNDSGILKIVLYRSKKIDPREISDSTILLPMASWRSIYYLARARVLFIQHSLAHDFADITRRKELNINARRKYVAHLWHGIGIKDCTAPIQGIQDHVINGEKPHYHLAASSRMDKLVLGMTFYPVNPNNIAITGIARNDFLRMPLENMPLYLQSQIETIRQIKKDRKLIVYAPTYRNPELGGYNYALSDDEIRRMKDVLRANNAILCLRMHYHNKFINYDRYVDNDIIFKLEHDSIPDMSALIREASIVISDYSSVLIDAIYNDIKVISFAYDYSNYKNVEVGLIYDLWQITNDNVCETFSELLDCVNRLFNEKQGNQGRLHVKKMFFEYDDDKNAERVVLSIKRQLGSK